MVITNRHVVYVLSIDTEINHVEWLEQLLIALFHNTFIFQNTQMIEALVKTTTTVSIGIPLIMSLEGIFKMLRIKTWKS